MRNLIDVARQETQTSPDAAYYLAAGVAGTFVGGIVVGDNTIENGLNHTVTYNAIQAQEAIPQRNEHVIRLAQQTGVLKDVHLSGLQVAALHTELTADTNEVRSIQARLPHQISFAEGMGISLGTEVVGLFAAVALAYGAKRGVSSGIARVKSRRQSTSEDVSS